MPAFIFLFFLELYNLFLVSPYYFNAHSKIFKFCWGIKSMISKTCFKLQTNCLYKAYQTETLASIGGMKRTELKFCKFILSTVFKSCAQWGKVMHSLAIKGFLILVNIWVAALLICIPSVGLVRMHRAIKDLWGDQGNVVAWSSMIDCLDGQGESRSSRNVLRQKEVRPNQHIFASIVCTAI